METRLTREIKAELIKYYRFERNMYAVQECMEKDVFVCDKKFNMFYEYEIKVSKSDLKAELKKSKHKCPNTVYYYIVVPQILVKDAIEVAERLNKKYGVMSYQNGFFRVARRAYKLGTVTNYTEKAFILKLTSDYAKWYEELQLYRNDRELLIPKCSKKAEIIYRHLLKQYSCAIVEQFEYVAESDEILYNNRRIKFHDKKVQVGGTSYNYKTKGNFSWIDMTMGDINRWMTKKGLTGLLDAIK